MQKRSVDRSAGPLRWLGAALTGLLQTPTTPAQINPGLSLWLDEKRGSRQFLQTDPIGYEDQVNPYAYVANDPVNHTDPTGMYELPQWLANLFAAGAPPPSAQQVQQGGGDCGAIGRWHSTGAA